MNQTTKNILIFGAVGVLVFIALKARAKKYGTPFNLVQEEVWNHLVKSNSSLIPLKDIYLKTEAFNDERYMRNWHQAILSQKPTFRCPSVSFPNTMCRTNDGSTI